MSTEAEKLEAIKVAVEVAKRRLKTLEALQSVNALTRSQQFELDMTIDCIKRGEKLLGSK